MTTATAPRSRKRQPKSPQVDPVTRYAQRVLSGEIVAGRAVRLACQRHLNDLQRQRTEAFPYYYDPAAAQHIIDFFPTFLTLENGDPFVLTGWQEFCFGFIFGWKRTDNDLRRITTAYIETGKGSGKSPSLAGVGLYCLAFDDEPSAEISSAAFDQDQASIILRDAIRMAKASDDLSDILEVGKYAIAHLPSNSSFKALSSEHRSKSGPRPSVVLIDELHEHRDGTVVNKMRAGFKGRKQPLLLVITNSGHDRTSICWNYHQHSLRVVGGAVEDERWFAYVCQLDPCESCRAEGYEQPKDGCEHCDDWTNPAVWEKANPAPQLLDPGYLPGQVKLAQDIPSEQAMIKRLNFCLWTESHQIWIPADRWAACKVPDVHQDNAEMFACAMGIDPSSTLDLTAAVVALRIDDPAGGPKPQTVEIEGKDEHGERIRLAYTLNFYVELIPFFWLPKETLLARVRDERIPYDMWARDEYLFTTPGPAIDHNAVYDYVLGLIKRFKVQRTGMDENSGRFLFMRLRDDGRLGDKIVSVGQGKKLSEAFKFIEILIAHRRLRHNGHPVLAWNIANAEPQRDRLGALWIEKPSETKRIDGAVASAMAIKELMTLPAKRTRSVGVMVV